MRTTPIRWGTASLVSIAALPCCAFSSNDEPITIPNVYRTWRTYCVRDGLPHNSIRAVTVVGDQVWIGTDGGLAVRRKDRWETWTTQQGLPCPRVSAIAVDDLTHDLWLGTWGGGLVRFSAGRFDTYNQFNSGLAGDLIFAVAVAGGRVWAATNAGLSAFNPDTDEWHLFAQRKKDEPQTAIACLGKVGDDLYAYAWGEGILHIDVRRNRGRLLPSAPKGRDGRPLTVHSSRYVTCALAANGRSLWRVTNESLWRRQGDEPWLRQPIGHRWGAGNRVHCLASPNEQQLFVGTDRGLDALVKWPQDTWLTYRFDEKDAPQIILRSDHAGNAGSGGPASRVDPVAPVDAKSRVRAIAFQERNIWVGTSSGLAFGTNLGPLALSHTERGDLQASGPSAHDRATRTGRRQSRFATARPLCGRSPAKESTPKSIAIAVVGPVKRTIALPDEGARKTATSYQRDATSPDLLAVQLAVEQVNAHGGYRGRVRFELASAPAAYTLTGYGWGTIEDELLVLAGMQHVSGLIAYLEPGRRATSLAVLRTEIPMVNVAPWPPVEGDVYNPWIVRLRGDEVALTRCTGDHPDNMSLLLDYLFERLGQRRIAFLRTPGPQVQTQFDVWARRARTRGWLVVANFMYRGPEFGLTRQVELLRENAADVVVTWCGASTSAVILQAIRQAKLDPIFIGSDSVEGSDFLSRVGSDPGRVFAVRHQTNPENENDLREFAAEYAQRNHVRGVKQPPGPNALRSYRVARLLLDAIDIAGPDRRAVQQTLRDKTETVFKSLEHGAWTSYRESDLGR